MRSFIMLSLSLFCGCASAMSVVTTPVLDPIPEEGVSSKDAVVEHKVAVDQKGPTARKCLVISDMLRIHGAEVFDGRDIEIAPDGCIVIEKGAQLVVRNATITGVSGDRLVFEDESSLLTLDRARLVFDGEYVFGKGIIDVKGPCSFEGVSACKSVRIDEDLVLTDETSMWSMEWHSLKATFTRHDYATLLLINFEVHKVGLLWVDIGIEKDGRSKSRKIKNFLCETDFSD